MPNLRWNDLPNSNASRGVPEPRRTGHNRSKDASDWLAQGLFVFLGVVGLGFTLANGYHLASLGIVVFVGLYVLFLGWMAHNEDRTQVKRIWVGVAATLVALEARHQYEEHQARERMDVRRRTPEPGKKSALDYGDR